MRRFLILACCTGSLLVLTALGAWRLSRSRAHQLVGELVTRVPIGDSLVALTFDDGPSPTYTDSVLAVLDSLGVRATFFMVGSSMRRHPDVVQRVAAAGHEVGNHSTTHRRLVLEPMDTIRAEIETTDSLVRALTGQERVQVRPPYGYRLIGLPLHLQRTGRPVVLWHLEPDTFHDDPADMVRYVREGVRPGSIVLLHVELRPRDRERAALPGIVAALLEAGYRLVTVSELLEAGATPEG